MIIGILGGDSTGLSAALASLGHEVIIIDGDTTATDSIVLSVGDQVPSFDGCVLEYLNIPDRDNSFRGGSRSKGGKIKYARR